jgi:hypothetical protein
VRQVFQVYPHTQRYEWTVSSFACLIFLCFSRSFHSPGELLLCPALCRPCSSPCRHIYFFKLHTCHFFFFKERNKLTRFFFSTALVSEMFVKRFVGREEPFPAYLGHCLQTQFNLKLFATFELIKSVRSFYPYIPIIWIRSVNKKEKKGMIDYFQPSKDDYYCTFKSIRWGVRSLRWLCFILPHSRFWKSIRVNELETVPVFMPTCSSVFMLACSVCHISTLRLLFAHHPCSHFSKRNERN